MKAQIKTRLAEDRPQLGTRLPFDTPLVLAADPSSICNLRCGFCPSGDDNLIQSCVHRKQQIMDFGLYKRMIDGLNEFQHPIEVLRLYKEGEPLVNGHFEEMVRYAKKSGRVKRIDTTTNGLLLNPERSRRIIDAGIDQINISVNGVSAGQYRKYTRRDIDFKKFVRNVKDLYQNKGHCEIYIKAIKDNLTEQEQADFMDLFGEWSDRIYLERIAEPWPQFKSVYIPEDVAWGNYDQAVEKKMVCPYVFYTLVINSDGTVSSCIGDWKHEQILGDVKSEKIGAIWFGKRFRYMWEQHLKGKKDMFPMCKECKVITHGCYDNIDAYADRILEKLHARQSGCGE